MRHLISALLITLLAPLAMAQGLTTEQAEAFIDSLGEVTEFSNQLDPAVRDQAFGNDMMPQSGETFAPYSRAMTHLRENHGDIHEDLSQLVQDHGFESPGRWAEIGDRVLLAYMSTQVDESQMAQITPEMLEQVPPQMREQMEGMLAMMETVKQVPPSDVEAIRPVMGRLQQYLQQQMGGPAQ